MELTSTAVTVPATPDAMRILRVMAADAAGGAGLSFDRYTDLEMAVAEAGALLYAMSPRSIRCDLEAEGNVVRLRLSPIAAGKPSAEDDLASLVLRAVAEDLVIDLDGATPAISFAVSGR